MFSREVWLSGRSGNSCLLQEICFCNSCVPGISVSYNFDSFWKQCEHRNWFPICIMSLPIWSPISVIYLRFTWCWALSYLQSCYWNVTYTNAMLYTMSYNYPFISIVGEYHGLYWPALQYCSDNFLQAGSAIREKDLLVSSVVLKANPFWSHKATMAVLCTFGIARIDLEHYTLVSFNQKPLVHCGQKHCSRALCSLSSVTGSGHIKNKSWVPFFEHLNGYLSFISGKVEVPESEGIYSTFLNYPVTVGTLVWKVSQILCKTLVTVLK